MLGQLDSRQFRSYATVRGSRQLIKKMEMQNKKVSSTAGRWTRAEHDKFMDALEKYGRDWVKVQKKVKTRTLLQIRSHAQKVFMNMSQQDIKAFIGSDQESEGEADEFLLNLKNKKNISTKNGSLNSRKNQERKKNDPEKDEAEGQSCNNDLTPKSPPENTENSSKKKTIKIIVSEVSNKESSQKQADAKGDYESLFLQMLRENQAHFMSGGCFLDLVWAQPYLLQPVSMQTFPGYGQF